MLVANIVRGPFKPARSNHPLRENAALVVPRPRPSDTGEGDLPEVAWLCNGADCPLPGHTSCAGRPVGQQGSLAGSAIALWLVHPLEGVVADKPGDGVRTKDHHR